MINKISIAVAAKTRNLFLQRIKDYLSRTSVIPMIADKPGGSYSMNFLAEEDPENPVFVGEWSQAVNNAYHDARGPGMALKYKVNPNLWCSDLLPQLSSLVIAKYDAGVGEQWRTRYGMIPITKRHVLCCKHAHSWASGTWPVNTNITTPTRLRWRGTDGETVERVLIHQAEHGITDLTVGILDEDLPETVYIPRIQPQSHLFTQSDSFAFSQEWSLASKQEQLNYWGSFDPSPNYTHNHRSMVWCSTLDGDGTSLSPFGYRVWGGDSGTPYFRVYQGELLLSGIVSGDYVSMPQVDGFPLDDDGFPLTFVNKVNSLIIAAEVNAIAMGRISAHTGYTVTVAPDPLYT